MLLKDINIRDPFILVHDGKYYMYGSRVGVQTGFDVYVSSDLENWSDPKAVFECYDEFWGYTNFWAPEVHYHNGKFYMFATFKSRETDLRGTGILISDTPDGTFTDHSHGPITPADWCCLDGTLYVENGEPYMVFCHEWVQITDGTVCAVKLTDDLKAAADEPKLLWTASDGSWVLPSGGAKAYVTDGPYIIKHGDTLGCIWSSFGKSGYAEGLAYSDNGSITGNWTVSDNLIFEKDGGHGMIFTDLSGKEHFVFHTPNRPSGAERPAILDISVADIISNK